MKRISLFLVIFLMFSLTGCLADLLNEVTGSSYGYIATTADDSYSYSFNYMSGILTISRINGSEDKDFEIPEDIEQSLVSKVVIKDGCTHLPDNAFIRLENLSEINLPSTCQQIGKNLFPADVYVSKFKTVEDKDGNITDFQYGSIKSILIKCEPAVYDILLDSDAEWRNGAYVVLYNNISSVKLYYSWIGYSRGSYQDIYLKYPWDELEFSNLSFGSEVENIPSYAFDKGNVKASIRTLELPQNLTTIENDAFRNQSQLQGTIYIPSSLNSSSEAFQNISKDVTFVLPKSSIDVVDPNSFVGLMNTLGGKNYAKMEYNDGIEIDKGSYPGWDRIETYSKNDNNSYTLYYEGRGTACLTYDKYVFPSIFDENSNEIHDFNSIYLKPCDDKPESYFTSFNGSIFLGDTTFSNLYITLPETITYISSMNVAYCSRYYEINYGDYSEWVRQTELRDRNIYVTIPSSVTIIHDETSMGNDGFFNNLDTLYDTLNITFDWYSDDSTERDFYGLKKFVENHTDDIKKTKINIKYKDGTVYQYNSNNQGD